MTNKLGEYILVGIMGFALLGVLVSVIAFPISALYAIWVDPGFALKVAGSAIIIFLSSLTAGFVSKDAHDEFYEEVDE